MTEIKEQDQQKASPLSLSRPGKLELKKTVEGGQVRQKFSHGRSKVVAVEVRKKRTYALDDAGKMTRVRAREVPEELPETVVTEEEQEIARAATASLTNEEKAARVRALQVAKRAGDEAPATGTDPEVESAAVEEPVEAPASEVEVPEIAAPVDVDTMLKAEAEVRKAEEEEAKRREEQAKVAAAHATAKLKSLETEGDDDAERARRRPGRAEVRRPSLGAKRGEPRRRTGKITITEALDDSEERTRSLASVRRAREREKKRLSQLQAGETLKVIRDVVIPETITVQELASRMAERGTEVICALMRMGVMATINQSIDADTAELIATEFGHKIKRVSESDVEIGMAGAPDEDESLVARPPVVTVMGHVDHGKT